MERAPFEPGADATIALVLVLRNPRNGSELGPLLWAALQEAASLYRRAARFRNVRFERRLLMESGQPWTFSVADNERVAVTGLDRRWRNWSSRTGGRTVDQGMLGAAIREMMGGWSHHVPLVVLTDAEITPPPDWRYIIWDSIPAGGVVSEAPLDPIYWGSSANGQRGAVIKQRARAACCSVVGSLLGLRRCDNPSCFLFEPVEAFTQLDHMVLVGSEHDIKELAQLGFLPGESAPDRVQGPRFIDREAGMVE